MGTLVRLADIGRDRHAPFFNRRELRAILSLYSERVARGEWRDYAIDQQSRHVGFAIFRSAYDWPLYVIAKFRPGVNRQGDYIVFRGDERIVQARTIEDVLSRLRATLAAQA
jgi:hypothetical protein